MTLTTVILMKFSQIYEIPPKFCQIREICQTTSNSAKIPPNLKNLPNEKKLCQTTSNSAKYAEYGRKICQLAVLCTNGMSNLRLNPAVASFFVLLSPVGRGHETMKRTKNARSKQSGAIFSAFPRIGHTRIGSFPEHPLRWLFKEAQIS